MINTEHITSTSTIGSHHFRVDLRKPRSSPS